MRDLFKRMFWQIGYWKLRQWVVGVKWDTCSPEKVEYETPMSEVELD